MQNRGKDFEYIIRNEFSKVRNLSIDRIHDQTTRYRGSSNICDFYAYYYPYAYYIECKTVHGNRLPLSNISDRQWKGLKEKSDIYGVYAGILCWWIDRDITKYLPITDLYKRQELGDKSIRFDSDIGIEVQGHKKKVFFNYDIEKLLADIHGGHKA